LIYKSRLKCYPKSYSRRSCTYYTNSGNNINTNEPIKTFHLTYPINSQKIIKVLNKVSKLKELKSDKQFVLKQLFKNLISSFGSPVKLKTYKRNKNHSGIGDFLLKKQNIDPSKTLKTVFLGRPGSGKTTTIFSANKENMLTCEVNATDTVGLLKEKTTIGIDYNECELEGGIRLKLYGTPGQKRYDYVQTQTLSNADIYIILIDLSSVAPFAEFMYYKNIIDNNGEKDALRAVLFTHYDIKENSMTQLSKEIRRKCHSEILTFKIDTRSTEDVLNLLNKLTHINQDPSGFNQHYQQNL